jgi:hypothetical protein
MNALAATHDAAVQMIDTSIIRVHQHATCIARNKRQSIGRARGGLTSKIHTVVDTNGLPVRLALTAGEAHDNRLAGKLLSPQCCWPTMVMMPTGSACRREGRLGQHPAKMQSQRADLLQPISLPCPEFGRAVLQ